MKNSKILFCILIIFNFQTHAQLKCNKDKAKTEAEICVDCEAKKNKEVSKAIKDAKDISKTIDSVDKYITPELLKAFEFLGIYAEEKPATKEELESSKKEYQTKISIYLKKNEVLDKTLHEIKTKGLQATIENNTKKIKNL